VINAVLRNSYLTSCSLKASSDLNLAVEDVERMDLTSMLYVEMRNFLKEAKHLIFNQFK
jgi:hypothetical protein